MSQCEHQNFAAAVNVNRLTRSEKDQTVIGYSAEVRINCKDCGKPFEFIGVDAGLSPKQPMASVDAQELRAPIQPKGLKIMPAIPGYLVKVN